MDIIKYVNKVAILYHLNYIYKKIIAYDVDNVNLTYYNTIMMFTPQT